MTSSRHLHTLHTPKGECAKCAVKMPTVHSDALCSDCATVHVPTFRDDTTELLRSTFGAGFVWFRQQLPDGRWAGGTHRGGGLFQGERSC